MGLKWCVEKPGMSVDGEIQNAYIEGNQVIVRYAHTVQHD